MMKTATLLAALCAGAEAFAPSPIASKAATALNTVWDDYAGGVDFRGGKFEFDPLGLAETYPPLVPWFRECEIRQGRTAMLAVVGFIVQDFVRIPGEMYSFEAIPNTIGAHDALLKSGPMYQLLFWIGLWDILITAPSMKAVGDGEREPGDFAWYWFAPKDPEKLEKKKVSELMNGRLAMCAVGGIATQSIITGGGFPYIGH